MDNQETVEPLKSVKKHNKPKKQEKNTMKNTTETLVKYKEIKNLPVPSQQQLHSLTELLNALHEKYGLTNQNVLDRKKIVKELSESVDKKLPDLTFHLFGSSISSFGFKTSDVNISVHQVEEELEPQNFIKLLNFLRNDDNYLNVEEDFQSKYPEITFIHSASGLTCRITSKDNSEFLTSNLLRVYGELDNRVQPLCVALRSWAKICHVDLPLCKTLPAFSFCLMVVHYLQQTDPPILPVIHELLENAEIIESLENDTKQELTTKVRGMWEPANKDCLGMLWLGLLKFYMKTEYYKNFVITVRRKEEPIRSHVWGKRPVAIEDPFIPQKNIARPMIALSLHYMVEHLKVALVYFGKFLPKDRCEADSSTIDNSNVDEFQKEGEGIHLNNDSHIDAERNNDDIIDDDDINDEVDENDDNIISDHDYEDDGNCDSDRDGDLVGGIFAMDTINDSPVESVERSSSPTNLSDASGADRKTRNVSETEDICVDGLLYNFNSSVLRKGAPIEHKCSSCGEFGHIASNCEEKERTVELSKLPEPPPWFMQILDRVCVTCFEDFRLTKTDVERRIHSVQMLQLYIQKQSPGARLHLFGSSCNGFGFNDSDLDICLMFENKTSEEIDCIAVIKSLKNLLSRNRDCREVFAITSAKVPIVKFYYVPGNLEADISLYNEMALHNTKLLATYVAIDQRVQILGYVLKTFVKLCDIGDASRGSLSSYAYILMLLHFLQQRQPPVIPLLQEKNYSDEKPVRMVKGCDCWFFSDLSKLNWNGQNRESCAELWLGFLRYYTEKFDFHHNVVTTRIRAPLTKFEKKWTGKKICIEDPFVLTHNLGAGVTQPMATFILSVFRKGRDHFGTPRADIPENPPARQRFFFNSLFLNNGQLPPTGNNCYLCGKIGHRKHQCQLKTANREGKKAKALSQKGKKDQKLKVEQKQRSDNKVVGHVVDGVKQVNHAVANGKRVADDATTASDNAIQEIFVHRISAVAGSRNIPKTHNGKRSEQSTTELQTGNDEYQKTFPLPAPFQQPRFQATPNSPPFRNTVAGPILTGHNPNSDQFGTRYSGPTSMRPMTNPVSPISQRGHVIRGNARPTMIPSASERQGFGTRHIRPDFHHFNSPPDMLPVPVNYSPFNQRPNLAMGPQIVAPHPIQRPPPSSPFNQRPNLVMGPRPVAPHPIQRPPPSSPFNQRQNLVMGPQIVAPHPIQRPSTSPPYNQLPNLAMGPRPVAPQPIQRPPPSSPFNQRPNLVMGPQPVASHPIQRPPPSSPFNQRPDLAMGPRAVAPQPTQKPPTSLPYNQRADFAVRPQAVGATRPIQRPRNSPPFNQQSNLATRPRTVAAQPIQRPLNPPPFHQEPNIAVGPQIQPNQRSRYAQLTTVSPWAVGGFVGDPPLPLLTCEALERDGAQPDPSLENVEQGFSPSVLKSLQAMEIKDDQCENDQNVVDQPFPSPPNVRNVAETSMFQEFDTGSSPMTEDSSIISEKLDQVENEPNSSAVDEKDSEIVAGGPSPTEAVSSPGETGSPGKKSRSRQRRGRRRKNGEKRQNNPHEIGPVGFNTSKKVDGQARKEKTEEVGEGIGSKNEKAKKIAKIPANNDELTSSKTIADDSKTKSHKVNHVPGHNLAGSPQTPNTRGAYPRKGVGNNQTENKQVDKGSPKQVQNKVNDANEKVENRPRVTKDSGNPHDITGVKQNIETNVKRKHVTNIEQEAGNQYRKQRGPRKSPHENEFSQNSDGNVERVKTPKKNPFSSAKNWPDNRRTTQEARSPVQNNPESTGFVVGDKNSEKDKKAKASSQRRNFRRKERKKQKQMEETYHNKGEKSNIEIQPSGIYQAQ